MIDEWAGQLPRPVHSDDHPAALGSHRGCTGRSNGRAAKGAKAIAFSENPHKLNLPSIHDVNRYWDPVFAAGERHGHADLHPHRLVLLDAQHLTRRAPYPHDGNAGGEPHALHRRLDLQRDLLALRPTSSYALSEGGIGWIPYLLERLDQVVDRQKHWASKAHVTREMGVVGQGGHGHTGIRPGDYGQTPSELFRKHIYGCFIDEDFGVSVIDDIGVDNVMIETDYPHTDSSWPNSRKMAQETPR